MSPKALTYAGLRKANKELLKKRPLFAKTIQRLKKKPLGVFVARNTNTSTSGTSKADLITMVLELVNREGEESAMDTKESGTSRTSGTSVRNTETTPRPASSMPKLKELADHPTASEPESVAHLLEFKKTLMLLQRSLLRKNLLGWEEAREKLTLILENHADLLGPLIQDIGKDVEETLGPALFNIGEIWTTVLNPKLQNIGQEMSEVFTPLFIRIGESLTETCGPMSQLINDQLTEILVPLTQRIGQDLTTALATVADDFEEQFGHEYGQMVLMLGSQIQKMGQNSGPTIQALGQNVGPWITELGKQLGPLVQYFGNNLGPIVQWSGYVLGATLQQISLTFRKSLNEFSKVLDK